MGKEELKVILECIHDSLTALQMLAQYDDYRMINYYKALEPSIAMIQDVIESIQ